MSEFHCHCECSKCPPLASTQAFVRFEMSLTALSIGPISAVRTMFEFAFCSLTTLYTHDDVSAENTLNEQ